MRKIILCLPLLICLSIPASAADTCMDDSVRQENQRLYGIITKLQAKKDIQPEGDLQSLAEENKKLAKMLVNNGCEENVPPDTDMLQQKDAEIKTLQRALSSLQNENKKLGKFQTGRVDNSVLSGINTQIKNMSAIEKQNQSLRETIKAQTDMLVSADNAIKSARKLSLENAALQKKLQQIEKSNEDNINMSKKLLERNNALQKEILQRDAYISKQDNLSEDKYALSQAKNMKAKILYLQKTNKKLEAALERERKSSFADRMKAQQYKSGSDMDDFASCGDGEVTSEKISYYRSNIAYLEAGIALKNKEIDFLKLENQELIARMKLAQENQGVNEDFADPFYSPNDEDQDLFDGDDDLTVQY